MRIFHPRPQPGRQKFIGVEFRDGVAEVDSLHPERRVALEQHGYAIQDDDGTVSVPGDWSLPLPDAQPVAAVEGTPLQELTVAELREIAHFEGIDVPKSAKKAEIREALLQASMAEAEQGAPERGYHLSDCAVHNEPADQPGPCDCADRDGE